MNYGKHYIDEDHANQYWWFCLADNNVYSIDELRKTYGFINTKEIEDTGIYIPMFQTDVVALEKDFMIKNIYTEKPVYDIMEKKNIKSYDTAFRVFIETHWLRDFWYQMLNAKLKEDAVNWGKLNGVPIQ